MIRLRPLKAVASAIAAALVMGAAPAAFAAGPPPAPPAAPQPARLDAKCAWMALPEADRTDFLAAWSTQGAAAQTILQRHADTTDFTPCGMTQENVGQLGRLIGAYAARQGAAQELGKTWGVAEPRLYGAWRALPEADRARFVKTTGDSDEASKAWRMSVIDTVAAPLGIKDFPGKVQLAYFFYGQAVLAQAGQ